MLRSIEVVIQGKNNEATRAYVVVTMDDDDVFVPIRQAMVNVEMREEVLERAKAEFESFRRKYRELTELAEWIRRRSSNW